VISRETSVHPPDPQRSPSPATAGWQGPRSTAALPVAPVTSSDDLRIVRPDPYSTRVVERLRLQAGRGVDRVWSSCARRVLRSPRARLLDALLAVGARSCYSRRTRSCARILGGARRIALRARCPPWPGECARSLVDRRCVAGSPSDERRARLVNQDRSTRPRRLRMPAARPL